MKEINLFKIKILKYLVLFISVLVLSVPLHANAQIECDFEDSFCGYTPNSKFVRYNGPSPSKSSGPPGDKTTGEGFYGLCYGSMLLDAADICEIKQNVILDTLTYFQFYYYMYGRQIGTLLLSINDSVVWSLSGSQEDEWLLSEKLVLPKGSFELKFVANRSADGRVSSDIAIDDLFIEEEPLTSYFELTSSTYLTSEYIQNISLTTEIKSTTDTTREINPATNITMRSTTISSTSTTKTTTKKTTTLTSSKTTSTITSTFQRQSSTKRSELPSNNYYIYIYVFAPTLSLAFLILVVLLIKTYLIKVGIKNRKYGVDDMKDKSLNTYYNVSQDKVLTNIEESKQ